MHVSCFLSVAWHVCVVFQRRCPGSQVAIQALTSRKVDLAFRVYHALIEGASADAEGGSQPQAMDTDNAVSTQLQ